MRQSQLFTKTRKEAPSDEVSKNAELLIRAGYIHKELAGVYDYLPLGLRVIDKIRNIIREEMNNLGAEEVLLSTLQDERIWNLTDRWKDANIDVWYKTDPEMGVSLGLGATHEEPMANMLKEHVNSYRDLPLYTYQFQNKFRRELRSKSGILRGKEFLMKDMYSFSKTEEELNDFYNKVIEAYRSIFKKVGIGDRTYLTEASGGMFSKISHEFQTICDAGEDIIYIDENKNIAFNKEIIDDSSVSKGDLKQQKAIEVGNIFKLGTTYSVPLGLTFKDEAGVEQPVIMGSYGIGLGRLMGTIVEVLSDEKGIVWPKEVAPFAVHLVRLGVNEKVIQSADKLYEDLKSRGIAVLYDDRDSRPGEKFADSDLIGIPVRFVVSDKTVEQDKIEVKMRTSSDTELLDLEVALKSL